MNNNFHYIEEVTKKLQTINPYKIILFGSYAYGTPNEDSDIDILVVTNDDFMPQTYDESLKYRLSISNLIYETAKKTSIDLLVYSKPMFQKFKDLDSNFSREILNNGKTLYQAK